MNALRSGRVGTDKEKGDPKYQPKHHCISSALRLAQQVEMWWQKRGICKFQPEQTFRVSDVISDHEKHVFLSFIPAKWAWWSTGALRGSICNRTFLSLVNEIQQVFLSNIQQKYTNPVHGILGYYWTKMGDSDSGIGVGTGTGTDSKFYQFGTGVGIGIIFFSQLESEPESELEPESCIMESVCNLNIAINFDHCYFALFAVCMTQLVQYFFSIEFGTE